MNEDNDHEFSFSVKINMSSEDWCDICGKRDPEYTALKVVSETADFKVGLCAICRLSGAMGLLYHSIKEKL